MTRPGQRQAHLLGGVLLLLSCVPVAVVARHAASNRRASQIQAVRRETAQVAEAIDAATRDRQPWTRAELAATFEQAVRASDGRVAWIQLRLRGGAVIAHAGLPAASVDGRASRYRMVQTSSGLVLAETFTFDLPVAILPAVDGGTNGSGVIEIAVYLNPPARRMGSPKPGSTGTPIPSNLSRT